MSGAAAALTTLVRADLAELQGGRLGIV